MRNNTTKFGFILISLLITTNLISQRECGMEAYNQQLLETDEDYAKRFEELMSMKKVDPEEFKSLACPSIKIVPVAVHFNNPVTCADPACLKMIVDAQLQVLNDEFAAANLDFIEYENVLNAACPAEYPSTTAPVQGEGACMQFCLATQNHPICSGLNNGDPAITVGQHDWPSAPGWEGYLNIFVSGSQGGLGVSVFPGNADGDGFWVTYTAFGAPGVTCTSGVALNTSVTYGLGRTATHEAGHYFGLPHVFGSCTDPDSNPPGPIAINDTPDQNNSYSGNPTINDCSDVIYDCPNDPVSFFSFMDYTDDAGYIMFTADQTAVMNWHANNIPFTNNATVCGGASGPVICPSAPTCSDGIQNGDEQGVDCGGAFCAACPSYCFTKFYDEGGPCGSYSNNQSILWTFCPDLPNQTMRVTFNSFIVQQGPNQCRDHLEVFDGNDTSAPQIGGEYCGNSVADAPGGGEVSASLPGGCLTFRFISNQGGTRAGWDADIFCESTVPVEFLKFEGKLRNGAIELDWSTAFEVNNKGFEIQRSLNAKDFVYLGFVNGEELSAKPIEYQYRDRTISQGKTYYYRIKQLDENEQYLYSDVISIHVNRQAKQTFTLSPNPITDQDLIISVNPANESSNQLIIRDLNGRALFKGLIDSNQIEISTNDWKSGIYLIEILENGKQIYSSKLVKL